MKYIEIRRNSTHKFSTLGVLGALALAPFFAPMPSAQAKPKDDAPAYGYRRDKKAKKNGGFWNRGRDRQDSDNDGRDDRDTDGDGDYDQNDAGYNNGSDNTSGNVSINGVVTRDLSGNRFEIRADNGQTIRVNASNGEPNSLSIGDRVLVRGTLTDGVLRADRVRVLDQSNNDNNDYDSDGSYGDHNNGGYNNGGYNNGSGNNGNYNNGGYNNGATRTINGVVTRDLSGRRFEIRADNGRRYVVNSSRPEPVRLTVGDRVQLQGRFDDRDRTAFFADNVRITRDDDRDNTGQGSQVNFKGTVVSIQGNTRLIVRGDNNRTYTVDTNSGLDSRISTGDRVQISGYGQSRDVTNATVSLLRDNGSGSSYNGSVQFSGTITKIGQRRSILTVKGNNGKTYLVSGANINDFRVGQRVRVVGTANNGVVAATSVTRR